MSKWLVFNKRTRPAGLKTDTWDVVNNSNNAVVGVILWYGPFRKYVFASGDGMVFDADCLKDIASYLSSLMLERKVEKQNNSTNNA